ncbi:MAG: 3-phosphoshikimate 1-carboxyvinyltransferase [Methanobrevibacter sp.]|uniref:3-phosphoshikimate 1-carboxyvinyltransferase n=1 Tax=Methanobrevibacter sp. TaxID=66852 RepID=UPI0026DF6C49|nr:3-phosphoshikimate 1-carboxyvinyltransferase [Methanobrevibacter sp.]MDO5849077.1 3-phosphoshikimate 1-carboxyvinyltransferase [Methanobrevibacter sp.]
MILKAKNINNIGGSVKAPPSKSYSHRAVILASLAEGTSTINDILLSEDVLSSIRACKDLGAEITQNENSLKIKGTEALHNSETQPINLENSGTTLRLMTSVAALADNETTLTGDSSLQTRPMQPLLDALKPLGVKTESTDGKAPITIKPGYKGGITSILGNISSQYISSIIISAPLSRNGVNLTVFPEFKSKPYVDMTLDIMEKFGIRINEKSFTKHEDCDKSLKDCEFVYYEIPKQKYKPTEYTVEGDYSSASYLLAAAAIAGGNVEVKNLFRDSKQGDKVILDILEMMGAEITRNDDSVIINSDGNLKGIDINLSNTPDLLITVAILAALAEGTTNITGVKHARVKETDRIDTTCRELEKLGCELTEYEDGMSITGGIHGGTVDSHGDHRLAMAFSLINLKHEVSVTNGEVFDVSFPNFIEAMESIGLNLELVEE